VATIACLPPFILFAMGQGCVTGINKLKDVCFSIAQTQEPLVQDDIILHWNSDMVREIFSETSEQGIKFFSRLLWGTIGPKEKLGFFLIDLLGFCGKHQTKDFSLGSGEIVDIENKVFSLNDAEIIQKRDLQQGDESTTFGKSEAQPFSGQGGDKFFLDAGYDTLAE
jgi:hypothetical protein